MTYYMTKPYETLSMIDHYNSNIYLNDITCTLSIVCRLWEKGVNLAENPCFSWDLNRANRLLLVLVSVLNWSWSSLVYRLSSVQSFDDFDHFVHCICCQLLDLCFKVTRVMLINLALQHLADWLVPMVTRMTVTRRMILPKRTMKVNAIKFFVSFVCYITFNSIITQTAHVATLCFDR